MYVETPDDLRMNRMIATGSGEKLGQVSQVYATKTYAGIS